MRWTWAQRASAVVLLALMVVLAHVTLPSIAATKAVLIALLVAGAAHAASSMFVLLTDYRFFAERSRRVAGATLVLGAATVLYGGWVIARSDAPRPVLGHLPGAACSRCHERDEHRRWPLALHAAKNGKPGVDCEGCHSVTAETPKLLAMRSQVTGEQVATDRAVLVCLECHGPHFRDPVWPGSIHGGFKCGTCHSRIETPGEPSWRRACHKCHPRPDDEHADVTALDTTYASPSSSNDFHQMKCQSCHADSELQK